MTARTSGDDSPFKGAAGIGGTLRCDAGSITISSGTVNTAGRGGAVIGGGTVAITGGNVAANGGEDFYDYGIGAGIGGGNEISTSTDGNGRLYLCLPASGSSLTQIDLAVSGTNYAASGTVETDYDSVFSVIASITTSSLPAGCVGKPYNAAVSASGGAPGHYTWSLTSGSLPEGLSLDSGTGVIS